MARFLTDVLPRSPLHDGADVGPGASVRAAQGSKAFASSSTMPDVPYVVIHESRVPVTCAGAGGSVSKAGAVGVQGVPAVVGPLKVGDGVVATVPVEVVDVGPVGWGRANERKGHKSMHPLQALFVVLAQHELMIAVALYRFAQPSGVRPRRCAAPPNPATIRHFVGRFITDHRSPLFCKGHTVKLRGRLAYV